jgi:hypothetical protein
MSPRKKLLEFIHPGEETPERKLPAFRDLLSGNIFLKGMLPNLRFLVWIVFLGFLYIANNYHAQGVALKIFRLKAEGEELRAEAVTMEARLMYVRRQSVVTEMIRQRGMELQEAVTPPYSLER